MEYFVYIICNKDGKIYIGQTSNMSKRLLEHNQTGVGYTSKYRPWRLMHTEKYDSREEAMQREKYLKTGVGRDWIKNNILRA